VGPGDEKVKLEDEGLKIKDMASLNGHDQRNIGEGFIDPPQVLLPPQIHTQPYQMIIKLIRAEKLPKMDQIGTLDCYLALEFAGAKYITKVIENNQNPVWETEILVKKNVN
jgi:hypothetical protein